MSTSEIRSTAAPLQSIYVDAVTATSIAATSVSSSTLSLSAQPYLQVVSSSAQALTDVTPLTLTTIWATPAYLEGGMLFSSGACTVPSTGKYSISLTLPFSYDAGTDATGSGIRGSFIQINGATSYPCYARQNSFAASTTCVPQTIVLRLAAGDIVRCIAYSTVVTAVDAGTDGTNHALLSIAKLF